VLPGRMPENGAVSIHRYDLSDVGRWSAVGLADFPQTDAAFEGDPPRCRHRIWP
jgi:hypothetical protein